jgi:hypothetical protein
MRKIIDNQAEIEKQNQEVVTEQVAVKNKTPKNLVTPVEEKIETLVDGVNNETT